MGRSLRSHKGKVNKTIKRSTYFGSVAKEREERLAARLHGSLDAAIATAAPPPAASMDVEAGESEQKPKISTAGWKNKKRNKRKLKTNSKKKH